MPRVKPLVSATRVMLPDMATEDDVRRVADRVRALAVQFQAEFKGNQTKTAVKLGIGQSVLSKLVNDEMRVIDLATLCDIVATTKVNPVYFFDPELPAAPDYRRFLMTRSGPLPSDEAPLATALASDAVFKSLEKFRVKHRMDDAELHAAERISLGMEPTEHDWLTWLDHWRRAKAENRVDLTEQDIARTSQRKAARRKRSTK